VLGPVVGFQWPFIIIRDSLPPPLLWMVLAHASTSTLMEGVLEPLFWPDRVAATLRTAEGFGELAPSVPMLMFHSISMFSQVPSQPFGSLPLYVPLLSELRFSWHPQPWSLRKFSRDSGLPASRSFGSLSKMEHPYATQKV
jgi:hypothetical protein